MPSRRPAQSKLTLMVSGFGCVPDEGLGCEFESVICGAVIGVADRSGGLGQLTKSCPLSVPPGAFWCHFKGLCQNLAIDESGEFTLVYPMLARLYPSAEMWPSGRRRSPAKGVGPEGSRGFESHRLRHLPLILLKKNQY